MAELYEMRQFEIELKRVPDEASDHLAFRWICLIE